MATRRRSTIGSLLRADQATDSVPHDDLRPAALLFGDVAGFVEDLEDAADALREEADDADRLFGFEILQRLGQRSAGQFEEVPRAGPEFELVHEKQSRGKGMTAADFTEEQLRPIRREFFAGYDEKRFYQERKLLVQAITFPAAHLLDRYGVRASIGLVRGIVTTVLAAIREHGNRRKIKRFSAYFLHAVHTHTQHHGEDYYQTAKEVRPTAATIGRALGKLQPGEAADTVARTLAEVHRTLRSRGGRKKVINARLSAGPDLFGEGSGRTPSASS